MTISLPKELVEEAADFIGHIYETRSAYRSDVVAVMVKRLRSALAAAQTEPVAEITGFEVLRCMVCKEPLSAKCHRCERESRGGGE